MSLLPLFPFYLPWRGETGCHDLSFLNVEPTFSLSSFTLIKRLFSVSSLSAIRVVSSAYLRLLVLLPAILIPACDSSSPAFHMMYSAYKLNKQGDNIQPWCTPFPIWNQSAVPCLVLLLFDLHTGFSEGMKGSLVFLSKNFSTVCCDPHSQSFSTANEGEGDVFLEFPFSMIQRMLAT